MRINTKELKNKIKILSKAANRNSDVIISVKNDTLKVITTEVSFTQYIDRDNTGDIEAVELQLSDFKKAINIIKSRDTNIDIVDGFLSIGNSKIKVSQADYTVGEKTSNVEKIILPANYITDALSKCIFYSSEAFKPILKGILFDFQKDKLILASTNGKVLNKEIMTVNSDIVKKIVLKADSIKSLLELKKQRKELQASRDTQGASFTILIYDLYVEFLYKNGDYDTFTFTSNIIEGKYPDIERVMPDFESKETRTITFSIEEAIKSIKELAFLCKENRYNNLYLKMKDGNITFYGISENSNNSIKSTIKASYDCKEDTIIGFNYKYLLDLLSVVNADSVELKSTSLLDGTDNFLLSYVKENNSIYLIMRVNLDIEETKEKINNIDNIDSMNILNSTITTDSIKHEEPIKDKSMRFYASEKEDKRYSKKSGGKYLKGYCFENRNGKLCQLYKFFYKAGDFINTVVSLGYDINKIEIEELKI